MCLETTSALSDPGLDSELLRGRRESTYRRVSFERLGRANPRRPGGLAR